MAGMGPAGARRRSWPGGPPGAGPGRSPSSCGRRRPSPSCAPLPQAPQLAPSASAPVARDPLRLPDGLRAVVPRPRTGGIDRGPPSARDRPARPGARRRRRHRRAAAAGHRPRARAVRGMGGAAHCSSRPPGLPRDRRMGARPGPAGRWSSATGRVPGRPCRGWPPPWSSTRTTRPTARRVRPPTARWTWSCERARREGAPCVLRVARASRRAGGRPGAPARWHRRPGSKRAGWATIERVDRRGADPRTRHVLRRVRAVGPRRARR